MLRSSPEEQLRILARISEEILPEEEFLAKLRRSREEDRPLRVKFGMDPTAPDLHLGNAVGLQKLRVFQELGHQPVVIIGDFTARVGDPSEAGKTRPMLAGEQIEANALTYLEQMGKILDPDGVEIRRNGEWFESLSFTEVMRLASRTTVARMIERDDFALRLRRGAPIGVHELLYPIMQGWDSVQVRADVEIGGTDQKFNLLFAREVQRAEGQEPQVIITHPLLVGLDGVQKMSKSLGNTIGILEDPGEMFGKAMSVPDDLMRDYFRWATDLSDSETVVLLNQERTHPRDAKEALAKAITTRYHSVEEAEEAARQFRRVFTERREPEEMPEFLLAADDLEEGSMWIVRVVGLTGFTASNGETRRLIRQGAVSINGVKITDEQARIEIRGGETLRVGRRRFARLLLG